MRGVRLVPVLLLPLFFLMGLTSYLMELRTAVGLTEASVCRVWDLTYANWQYTASGGGYGIMNLSQDVNRKLTGTWHNQANGASGTFTGTNSGVTFGLHANSGEDLVGTVDSSGRSISGRYEGAGTTGTWNASGVAVCIESQAEPPAGTAQLEIRWGHYVYYAGSTMAAQRRLAPDDWVMVQRINAPGGVNLRITARFDGQNLPASVVVNSSTNNGPFNQAGVLTQISASENSAVYQGTIFIPATGLAPGQSRSTRVEVTNPVDGSSIPAIIVNQTLVDPAGYIYDSGSSAHLPGAMATLYKQEGSDWVMWPAELYGQVNPLVADETGHYAWETDAGTFKVKASMDGYQDGEGGPVTVPPPVLDLHIGLDPVAGTPPEVDDPWLSVHQGWQSTEFLAGETMIAHMTVTNTASADAQTEVTWTTTDPQGNLVPELSGSRTYIIGSFPVDIRVDGRIPPGSPEGWYTMRLEVERLNQTQFKGTQFYVHPALGVVYLPFSFRAAAQTQPPPDAWITLLTEDFEGAFPGNKWGLSDHSDQDGGQFLPGKRSCRVYGGAFAGWMIGGGGDGSQRPCGAEYASNLQTWMVYGPFSLADATAAELRLMAWVNSESGYDRLFWGASTDNEHFSGWVLSGGDKQWAERTLDLADVPNQGSMLGKSMVWIALVFDSDESVQFNEGAYVDDILLRKKTGTLVVMPPQSGGTFSGERPPFGVEGVEAAEYVRPQQSGR